MKNLARTLDALPLNLNAKLTLAFFFSSVIVSLLISLVLFRMSQRSLMRNLYIRMENMTAIAAQQVDGDAFQTLLNPADANSPAFQAIDQQLKQVLHAGTGIANIYTMRLNDQGQILFVVDSSPEPAALGEVYDDASPLLSEQFATLNQAVAETEYYTDKWGTWYSGYAPIHSSSGQVVGVLGMDISADEVVAEEQHLLTVALLTGGGASLVISLLAYLLIRNIVNPIKRISGIAQRLSSGNITLSEVDARELEHNNPRGDELGEISRAFHAMLTYLEDLSESARVIAGGDMRVDLHPKSDQDHLGLAFSQMSAGLRSMIADVSDHAQTLTGASEDLAQAIEQAGQASIQISTSMQSVTQGSSHQSDSAAQTAVSIRQMTVSINEVAQGAQRQTRAVEAASAVAVQMAAAVHQVNDNAARALDEAALAAQAAQSGAQTVAQTIHGMQAIRAQVNFSADKVQEMGRRSDQIGAIIETIEAIASQTNLLALNAAIEAARAGEHGKGFGVVADEVRKLAEKSAAATHEIADLLKSIQAAVGEAVEAMQGSASQVEAGVVHISHSDAALENIRRSVERVNARVTEINTSAQQIGQSVDELTEAMHTVTRVVEENTMATEEMAAGSNEMSSQIQNIAAVSAENYHSVQRVGEATEAINRQAQLITLRIQSLTDMTHTLQARMAHFQLK